MFPDFYEKLVIFDINLNNLSNNNFFRDYAYHHATVTGLTKEGKWGYERREGREGRLAEAVERCHNISKQVERRRGNTG